MASKKLSNPFPVTERDILHSNTTRYLIVNFNGEGCFGKVARCLDLIKGKMVAVKIHKKSRSRSIRKEVEMLEAIRNLDPDKNNIVKFMEHFRFNNLSCLTFEMLDKSLWDLMKEREWKTLSLNEIRPVTHQLLVAFQALKLSGLMHTDLKPDNVMLVDHQNQPFKIKLIDFGLALPVDQAEVGMGMQACAYRAPEVTLGLPLSESVDMWGVGCVMAFLYFGVNLFPADCAYHRMKLMLQLLGEPDDHLLDIGLYSKYYFTMAPNSRWRLRTPEEYEEITGEKPSTDEWYFDCDQTLDDIVRSYPSKMSVFEFKDRMAFADLMISCLHPNYYDRITPKEAMKHKFFASPQDSDESEDDWSCEESNLSSLSLSAREIPIIGCSSTDTDSSSGIDASAEEDGKEPEKKECAPVKRGCGQTYTRPRDEEECDPEHSGKSEDDCSCKESYLSSLSDLSSLSLSPGEIQIMDCSSTDTESSSGINNVKNNEEQCAPAKCDCGQSYTSNHASCPSSPGNDDINPNKSCGPAEQDQQATTDLNDGVRDTATPPREEPGPIASHNNVRTVLNYLPVGRNDRPSSDKVPNGGAAASISSNHGATASISSNCGSTTSLSSNNATTAPIGSAVPDNIETGPVRVRRKTVLQRIGRFFCRVRKLFRR